MQTPPQLDIFLRISHSFDIDANLVLIHRGPVSARKREWSTSGRPAWV